MKQFKAESKRLLDLMVNSIYTHKEIFLRELISNASDAIDKLYFLSLTDDTVGLAREDFEIFIQPNKDNSTLTISDNGIGMTKEQLEDNLGVIASSGSLKFRKEHTAAEGVDIIGQFGVGFYSAFMVAKKLTVISRAFGSDEAYKWESSGADGYTITTAEKDTVGTDVILVLKEDGEEEKYSDFLQTWKLEELIKRYSDYIRYPIKMDVEKTRKKIGSENDYEQYTEMSVLNSMVPIWKRPKGDVTEEDFAEFYSDKFGDYSAPAHVIQSSTEGTATYNALLFIPSRPPYDYYTKDYEKGLQLYASGVLIMDKCADLLPDYFSFVKGLVDSWDLSLNISREMLQHDRQLKLIRNSLERKIRSELAGLLSKDRKKYEEFFKNFGLQLKVGVYSSYGANAETLKDLLLFHSADALDAAKQNTEAQGEKEEDATEQTPSLGYLTLKEYVQNMPEEQKYIYYAAGDKNSMERLVQLPQAKLVRSKGYDLLLLTDEVDEFALQMLRNYDEKEFRNISGADLGLESEEEQKQADAQNEQYKEMFDFMKEALSGKVSQVKASSRAGENPAILTAAGGLSLEMEKVLNSMPTGEKVESQKVLEVSTAHPLFAKLQALFAGEGAQRETLSTHTRLLYAQALLIEGLPIEDPAAYSRDVSALLAEG